MNRARQTTWGCEVLAIVLFVASVAGVFALGWTSVTAQDASVSVGDNFYDPNTVAVQIGSTVTWMNNGQTTHTVTSDDGSFDSGLSFEPGHGYSVFFEFPGVYGYHCQIHGTSMSGRVTVQGPETPTPTPTPHRTVPPTPTPPPTSAATPAPVVTSPTPTAKPRPVTATSSPRPSATQAAEGNSGSRNTLAVLGLIALGFLAGLGVMAFRRGRSN